MENLCSLTEVKKVYVGIDPSITNTGVVILDEEGKLLKFFNGKDSYKKSKTSYSIKKYAIQVDYIVEALMPYHIQSIGYENYSFNSTHKAYSLAEYNGILKHQLILTFNDEPLLIAPTSNKKFAVNNGSACKERIKLQAASECSELINQSDDVCDAYFLAKFAFYKDNPSQAVISDKGNDFLRSRLELIKKDN